MIKNKLMKTNARPDVIFEKGDGSYLYDKDQNAYLDFVAGVAVNALGHCSPVVTEAIEKQSKQLIHLSNLFWTDAQLDLAEFLINESNHEEVFFVNSGTEAIETAIKIARKYGKGANENKGDILYLENSFHGRTVGALSLTGQLKYQADFMPLMGKVKMGKVNSIADLESKISENTCALFLEPIQAEGGVVSLNSEFIKAARSLCDKYEALLVFDEVQCGIGRIGTFYAYESIGVIPDILCLAKGLGGGFPIGAVLANKKANVLELGDHGCTFGGSPLACATSHAVVSVVKEQRFLDSVKEKGKYIKDKLEAALEGNNSFKSVEGKGMLLGLHLNIEAKAIVEAAFKEKLLIIRAGEKVIRIVPALNISNNEIDKGLDILIKILRK